MSAASIIGARAGAAVSLDFATGHGLADRAREEARDLAKDRSFHTLDALRGVAATIVVLFHAAFIYGIAKPAEGQIAVDLFFVMSGFVIAYRYDDALRRGLSPLRFAAIRLIRLYPLFYLGTLLGVVPAVIALANGDTSALHRGLVESLPLALLMLPSRYALPQIQELFPLNIVAWSLALEIAVNILYAATVQFWTLRRLAGLMGVAFVGLVICAAVYGSLKYGYAWPGAPVGFVRIVYGFGAGVLIHRVYARTGLAVRIPWWLIIAATLAVFVFAPMRWTAVWELAAISVLMPAIVVAAVVNEPPRVLWPVCATLGALSYALYSLHVPLIGFLLRGEARAHLDINIQTWPETIVYSSVLLLACIIAHAWYDKPVRRRLSQWIDRRSAAVRLRAV